MSNAAPIMRMRNVSKWYGDFQALAQVSLEVQQGEVLVICGPSGSGKSTMIRCINALERFDEGEIVVGEHSLSDARHTLRVRREVGMVFQQFNLFPHMTVLENLTLAPMKVRRMSRSEAEALAREYLQRVRITDQAAKYPAQLSGGQQQRVAIARALCMQPRVMLFDEPTSALDPEMVGEVLDTMVDLAHGGMTIVCVTHEMAFARQVANRIVFMDRGRIVVDCSPAEFFDASPDERIRTFLRRVTAHDGSRQ